MSFGCQRNEAILTALIGCLLILKSGAVGAEADIRVIGGAKPNQRPVNVPTISEVEKPSGWYSKSLTGIPQPYPASLDFLEDQGNWFTPFIVPGMTGPYDLRNWHSNEDSG